MKNATLHRKQESRGPRRARASVHVGVAAIIAIGSVAFLSAASRPDATGAATAVTPPSDVPLGTSTELGGGFVANIEGTTVQIANTCPSDQGLSTQSKFNNTAGSLITYDVIKLGSPVTLENDFGRIYKFGCGPGGTAGGNSECVAFSEKAGTVTPTVGVCPSFFPASSSKLYYGESFEGAAVPGILFPSRLGANAPFEDMAVRLPRTYAKDCDFGDKRVLSIDGADVASWPVADEGGDFVLPQLSGTHRLTTNCRYNDAAKPTPAQRGTCVSVTFNEKSFTTEECTTVLGAAPGKFDLRTGDAASYFLEGQPTTVVGGCGGYGFAAYKASADGIVSASAAVVGPNEGDIAPLKVALQADPGGFFVGSCWTDLAGTVAGPLVCYRVVSPSLNEIKLEEVAGCPFTVLRSVQTL